MHYKNNAEAKIGDIVIGKTHNSNLKLRIGKVIELNPQRGPCNVKLVIFALNPLSWRDNEGDAHVQFTGGVLLSTPLIDPELTHNVEVAVDYADVAELFRVMDCFRSLEAVIKYGSHDSPYFPFSADF